MVRGKPFISCPSAVDCCCVASGMGDVEVCDAEGGIAAAAAAEAEGGISEGVAWKLWELVAAW